MNGFAGTTNESVTPTYSPLPPIVHLPNLNRWVNLNHIVDLDCNTGCLTLDYRTRTEVVWLRPEDAELLDMRLQQVAAFMDPPMIHVKPTAEEWRYVTQESKE
jgi:hypothetical protein